MCSNKTVFAKTRGWLVDPSLLIPALEDGRATRWKESGFLNGYTGSIVSHPQKLAALTLIN